MRKRKVLILGGGFAGIKAAQDLSTDRRFDITLVSEEDHFRFYPALYHTATGGARKLSQISLSELFSKTSVRVLRARAETVHRTTKTVHTKGAGTISYDTLLIALGMTTNYFGIPGLEQYSYGIKSVDEAERFKKHLHDQILRDKKPDLHYVIVGGGPTGVELAGMLPSYLSQIMKHHGIKHKRAHVELIEAAPRILPRLPKDVSKATARQLRKLGVAVRTNQKVEAETADALMINGKPLKSHTVVWTAGVACNSFFLQNNFTMSEHHKVVVNNYLQVEGNIYVMGDNADTPYSGVAQTALYDARFVARNLKLIASGRPPKQYKPKLPLYVTPTGPGWATLVWGKLHLHGWLAGAVRKLADLIAYHDYQPWWSASKRWLAEEAHEEPCFMCND